MAGAAWAGWALGLLALGGGRPDAALAHLEALTRGPARHQPPARHATADLVEAAVRLGRPQQAIAPLAGLTRSAGHAQDPATDALLARCHALLAVDGDAERHYLAALRPPQGAFQQARTRLLYGAWLRRARRNARDATRLLPLLGITSP